jgi:type VI secretion system secreted protein Hcp
MAPKQFYVAIDGARQGAFKGEGSTAATKSKIIGLAFSYGVTSLCDPVTGLPTGKRQHTNEVLKSVLFVFLEPPPDGKEAVAYTIALSNAAVSAVTLAIPGPPEVPAGATQELQGVSLTFQKIEIRSLLGQTSTVDDWTSGA